ncbi:hypothetical protein ACFTZB_01000, partial [Rhodococcus sp. NPDC057014]|uniref:hypothetical protein n=1 Tax=Rhodococcus sp. NPDC057014 TaxID=3346000 RepID=UPI00364437EB
GTISVAVDRVASLLCVSEIRFSPASLIGTFDPGPQHSNGAGDATRLTRRALAFPRRSIVIPTAYHPPSRNFKTIEKPRNIQIYFFATNYEHYNLTFVRNVRKLLLHN